MQVSFSSNRETKGCLVAYRFDGQNVARPSSIKESKISPSIQNLLKKEREKKERHFSIIKTRERIEKERKQRSEITRCNDDRKKWRQMASN